MSFRQLLNVVYGMHVEKMDAEQRANFDEALAAPLNVGKAHAPRDSVQERAMYLNMAPAVIPSA